MKIKILEKEKDIKRALELVWKVFLEFEAPEYSDEGINNFKRFIDDEEEIEHLNIYAMVDNEKIIGVLATRCQGKHISLFFVDKNYQNKGIGRKLFEELISNTREKKITVNSSPYAVEIYHRLGFKDIDKEQIADGIRYTPMEINIE